MRDNEQHQSLPSMSLKSGTEGSTQMETTVWSGEKHHTRGSQTRRGQGGGSQRTTELQSQAAVRIGSVGSAHLLQICRYVDITTFHAELKKNEERGQWRMNVTDHTLPAQTTDSGEAARNRKQKTPPGSPEQVGGRGHRESRGVGGRGHTCIFIFFYPIKMTFKIKEKQTSNK